MHFREQYRAAAEDAHQRIVDGNARILLSPPKAGEIAMAKDEFRRVKDAQDGWEHKAYTQNIKCEDCGITIPYGERDTYYSSRRCVRCEAKFNDDE